MTLLHTLQFEEITIKHIDEVKEIYNYYVRNSTISFHTEELNIDVSVKLSTPSTTNLAMRS